MFVPKSFKKAVNGILSVKSFFLLSSFIICFKYSRIVQLMILIRRGGRKWRKLEATNSRCKGA